jgi:hypothetical protein
MKGSSVKTRSSNPGTYQASVRRAFSSQTDLIVDREQYVVLDTL